MNDPHPAVAALAEKLLNPTYGHLEIAGPGGQPQPIQHRQPR